MLVAFLGEFGDAIDFLFKSRDSVAGGVQVGGGETLPLLGKHMEVTAEAVLLATLISVPLAIFLAHTGRGAFAAASVANVGRAVPSLAVVLFFSAYLGFNVTNLVFGLTLLAIPPIFTNTFVGIRQVDKDVVDAARGQGLSGLQVVSRVEIPLSLPLIFGGIRTSYVNVVATATLGPLVGVVTLGDPILSPGVYGQAGQLGTAILVALLALVGEVVFAQIQRIATPAGIRTGDPARAKRLQRRRLTTAPESI